MLAFREGLTLDDIADRPHRRSSDVMQ
jgi:hypothetical protein